VTKRWQPIADWQHLRLRAQMLNQIRQFFAERDVLEVETPLLCSATGTDPQLDFFSSKFNYPPQNPTLYLQTSPEFAMKRLLAAGSGSIYQICKAFRNGESGRSHNPEFTILEWYRVGYDLPQLMTEVAELLQQVLPEKLAVIEISYQQIFQQITDLDALAFNFEAYQTYALTQGLVDAAHLCGDDHALWLDFLFSHCVQTALTPATIWLIHSYPAIQSSLARLNSQDPRIAERFEVLINGMELGNGFYELADAEEQSARFDQEIVYRQQHGLATVAKDQLLIDALAAGLPDCSGIAIGIDRLLMIASGSKTIDQVLAFPLQNA
jgi:lysyl-tRNA synthetase class 2